MLQQTAKMRISSQYIGRAQYILDPSLPMATLFETASNEAPENSYRRGTQYRLGYSVTLLESPGYCALKQYILSTFGDNAEAEPARYTTEETLNVWDFEAKKGWVSLEEGEWWQKLTTKESSGYGYILGSQLATYLNLKGLSVRLIAIGNQSLAIINGIGNQSLAIINGKDIDRTRANPATGSIGIANGFHIMPYSLYIIEAKALPKNPLFSRRKRQIVYT